MRPADTTPEAHAVQIAIYRRLGPEGRMELADRLSMDVRALSRAGIRARHPEYSPDQVEQALRRLLLGDELFRKVWPGQALLPP
jgi:hypothetical protein